MDLREFIWYFNAKFVPLAFLTQPEGRSGRKTSGQKSGHDSDEIDPLKY